jgi:hypothetical protein
VQRITRCRAADLVSGAADVALVAVIAAYAAAQLLFCIRPTPDPVATTDTEPRNPVSLNNRGLRLAVPS